MTSAAGDHDLAVRPVREGDLPVLVQLAGREASGWNSSGHRSAWHDLHLYGRLRAEWDGGGRVAP